MERTMHLLAILSLAALILSFMALHDIAKDYASPETWSREGRPVPDWIPAWTECPLEWRMVEAGLLVMLAFHALYFVRWIRRREAEPMAD